MAIVRERCPDRYVATLYAPVEKRGHLFAIYGFDAEISQIAERVSEPMPGEIRMQWWQDVIAGDREIEAAGNPVAAALIDTINAFGLPRQNLANLIEARIFDLYSDPMPSRNDLEGYCGETASAVFQFSAMVLDASAANDASECSGHAGVAYGLAGLLQSLPLTRTRGQCFVPVDMLNAAGTNPDEFLTADRVNAQIVEIMVALANDHMRLFEAAARHLPKQLIPAFLPIAPVRSILVGRDLGTGSEPIVAPHRRQLSMLRRAIWGWN